MKKSLIFCFLKCCAVMSQRLYRLKGDKREKEAQHPPQAGRQRGGGTRFGKANDAEGSSSQEVASWTRRSISIISINMRHIRLSMSSLTSRRVRLRRSRGWSLRLDRKAFLGGLMSCRFYRTSVNTWHAGYGSIRCKYNCSKGKLHSPPLRFL
jgi:hypothetical protein